MIWLNSIYDLQYYNPPKGVPCFCETLTYPSDLMLQSPIEKGSGSYTISIRVYSPDGLTEYEIATSYFNYFFAVNPVTQEHYFAARLNGYSNAMCTHKCWILRVIITDNNGDYTRFDKYTERYCQFSCCDVARDISVIQDGLAFNETTGTTTVAQNPKISGCGDRFITLRTKYDCYDKFTGEYYGTPNTVLSGNVFSYENISTFRGRVVRRPREITRQYSYNCRLQRVESAQTFLLEGFELFPAWKMNEIEAQLHSTEIYVDDIRYEFNGGTAFELLSDCVEVFKLNTVLNGCIQRQVFGCETSCSPVNFDGSNIAFIMPQGYYNGSDSPYQPGYGIYSESGVLIAENYQQLLDYYRNLPGVTSVDEIGLSMLSCAPYGVFTVTGSGYIPSSFYITSVQQNNRVFGTVYDSISDICDSIPVTCNPAELGTPVVEEDSCAAAVLGTPTVEDMEVTGITIVGFGDWVIEEAETEVTMYQYQVTMDLKVSNAEYIDIDSPPSGDKLIQGEHIATIGAMARPIDLPITLDSTNSNMPADTFLFIDINGFIYFTGYGVTTPFSTSITLTDIQYNTQ